MLQFLSRKEQVVRDERLRNLEEYSDRIKAFESELAGLIESHRMGVPTNTSNDVLSKLLVDVLKSWNEAHLREEQWSNF